MDFCSGFTGKAVAEGGRGSPWQLLAKGTGWLLGTNSSRGPRGPVGGGHPKATQLPPWSPHPFGEAQRPSPAWNDCLPHLPPATSPQSWAPVCAAAGIAESPTPTVNRGTSCPAAAWELAGISLQKELYLWKESGLLGLGRNLGSGLNEAALPRQALSGESRIPGGSRAHPTGPHPEDSGLSGQFKRVLPTPSANTHRPAARDLRKPEVGWGQAAPRQGGPWVHLQIRRPRPLATLRNSRRLGSHRPSAPPRRGGPQSSGRDPPLHPPGAREGLCSRPGRCAHCGWEGSGTPGVL